MQEPHPSETRRLEEHRVSGTLSVDHFPPIPVVVKRQGRYTSGENDSISPMMLWHQEQIRALKPAPEVSDTSCTKRPKGSVL